MRSILVVWLIGAVTAGILAYWVHPLVAAGIAILVMFPVAIIMDTIRERRR